MFGTNTTTQSNDDPAMLDNVKQLASQPTDQITGQAPDSQTTQATAPQPQPQQVAPQANGDLAGQATSSEQAPASDKPTKPLNGFAMDTPQNTPQPQEQTSTSQQASQATQETQPQSEASAAPNSLQSSQFGSVASPAQNDSSSDQSSPVSDPNQTENNEQSSPAQPQISSDSNQADPNHLAGLKQQALQHLEPLTDHLGDTPEEQFKTTMMMIQANDNHTLLEKALEAAKQIEDDKVRAQAMLDIINEINYFSQNQ